jgi:acyl carrier protein
VEAIGTVLGGNGDGHGQATNTAGNGHANGRLKDRLEAATTSDRLALIESHVRQEVSRILGLPEWPDPRSGFFELGMDSLSASELVGALHRELGRTFPVTVLFERSNAGALAQYIQGVVLAGPPNGNGHGSGNGRASDNCSHPTDAQGGDATDLDSLSTDEMAGLFAKMLNETKGPTP